MHDFAPRQSADGATESKRWRMMFIGSTSDEALGIRDTLREVYPDWFYNWQPDGSSAQAFMTNNGFPHIALISANLEGMSCAELVEWIRASPCSHYIPTIIYNARADCAHLLDCPADAVVNDTDIGQRDLIKISDRMMRCVRLGRLPSIGHAQ